MSVSFVNRIPDLIIPVGSNVSQTVESNYVSSDAAMIGILSPASFQALTMVYEVSVDGVTFATLQAGTPLADVGPPAINKAATSIELVAWPYWRIKASGNAAVTAIAFQASTHWTAGD